MSKIAVLLCLVVACYAQPTPEPIRPLIAATFSGEYTAWMSTTDRFGHIERTGKGWRAYDDSRGVGVKNTTFQVSPTEYESEYRLERYDLGRVFDVRTEYGRSECRNNPIAGSTMPGYWNWVEYATYDGTRRFPWWDNPAELEWWRLEVSGERYELGVFPDNPDKPVIFTRSSGVDNWRLEETYVSFEETTPYSFEFDIPIVCQQQQQSSSLLSSHPATRSGRIAKLHSITLHRRNQRPTRQRFH